MKTKIVAILTLAAIFLGACGTPAAPKRAPSTSIPESQGLTPTAGVRGSEVKITISGFKFDPATITISVGTTVTWTNQDSVDHLVAGDDGNWRSEAQMGAEPPSIISEFWIAIGFVRLCLTLMASAVRKVLLFVSLWRR